MGEHVAGCIPASAGESGAFWRMSDNVGVHPRERGGIRFRGTGDRTAAGASPRARGNRRARMTHPVRFGCIPASAGESQTECIGASPERVHPRERGGITAAAGGTRAGEGASPRARGNRPCLADVHQAEGCIPASAGESAPPNLLRVACGVHPRERGGIGANFRTVGDEWGASPRARGNRRSREGLTSSAGCIPASAGESGERSRCRHPGAVHPRERGGIARNQFVDLGLEGASPRARGNLQEPPAARHATGCIPASAGESRHRRIG